MSPQKNKLPEKLATIILCAGEGRRISHFIKNIPKPLIKINNKPILYYLITNLCQHGITSINIITGHLAEKIEKYISLFSREDITLQNKITLINSGLDYKKGPLYSFLSIIDENFLSNKEFLYLVLPGDTYFEKDLIDIMITSITENLEFIQNNSVVFYQKLQKIKLKNTLSPEILISVVNIKEGHPLEIVRGINQINLGSIDYGIYFRRLIPVFVFNYNFIQEIINTEKNFSVKTLREIVNKIIKDRDIFYAIPLNSKLKFYDIDTKSDLVKAGQRKEDNRRSD
ncbi:MAG: sugar phosphate nucleotidyltransferase [Promethearchaeota archaeon]